MVSEEKMFENVTDAWMDAGLRSVWYTELLAQVS